MNTLLLNYYYDYLISLNLLLFMKVVVEKKCSLTLRGWYAASQTRGIRRLGASSRALGVWVHTLVSWQFRKVHSSVDLIHLYGLVIVQAS